jgi:Uma2 family endonuclease
MTAALQKIEFHPTVPAIQVWNTLPEGIRAEVIDNKLYVLASPTPYHQETLWTLSHELKKIVYDFDLGKVWVAPIDVFLEEGRKNVVVPDIIFIAHNNSTTIERRGLFGVPDLLIEILSPGTRKYDFTKKKNLYELTGVKEYWLVDPETKQATGYLLDNGSYGKPLLLNSEINIRILNKSIKF